jgi:RES domain-containing protein
VTKAISVWRIAADSPAYTADDRSGKGAELTGGRWNEKGVPLLYTSESRALACLETLVHLNSAGLPLNRYLVELLISADAWAGRERFDAGMKVGWDAEPPGKVSIDWGTRWARDKRSLVAEVPSAIVPEEANLLLNPLHPDAAKVQALKRRKWTYDARLA